MTNCYFCKDLIHNPQKVRMWDGRIVDSCHICREIVVDSKSCVNDQEERLTTDHNFSLSNHDDVLSPGKDKRTVIK